MATEREESTLGDNPDLVYLDSNFYFDYLISNREGHEISKTIVEAWNNGDVEIATSTLTLAEVLYVVLDDPSARRRIDRSRDADITDLFNQYGARKFRLVELDRSTAESARQLVWDHDLRPKDAIHVATALRAHCPVMFSRDRQLLSVSGAVGGQPILEMTVPVWSVQTSLDFDDTPD